MNTPKSGESLRLPSSLKTFWLRVRSNHDIYWNKGFSTHTGNDSEIVLFNLIKVIKNVTKLYHAR